MGPEQRGDSDDVELARRASQGDAAALEAWCVRLEGPLYGYAYRLTGDRHAAEDLVQECLVKLITLTRESKLQGRAHTARAFVFTILHNLAIDHLRTSRRTVPLASAPEAEQYDAPGASLLRDEMQTAIAHLPEKQRSALTLREIGDLSYADIAGVLGVSLAEVKILIHRGRKRLAQLLDRDGQYIGIRP